MYQVFPASDNKEYIIDGTFLLHKFITSGIVVTHFSFTFEASPSSSIQGHLGKFLHYYKGGKISVI